MTDEQKSPAYMTSIELEEAIRRHRDYARRLIAEVKSRRAREAYDRPDGNMQKDPNAGSKS